MVIQADCGRHPPRPDHHGATVPAILGQSLEDSDEHVLNEIVEPVRCAEVPSYLRGDGRVQGSNQSVRGKRIASKRANYSPVKRIGPTART
jgi:hypothetical protein